MRTLNRNNILWFLLALGIAVLLSLRAHAGERIDVYNHYPGHSGGIIFYSPSSPDIDRPCFPYGCGGISGPFTNPDPDARKPENLTACSYDANDILFYEREGKYCPYKRGDPNVQRVEKRRQEWLREQRRANKKRR